MIGSAGRDAPARDGAVLPNRIRLYRGPSLVTPSVAALPWAPHRNSARSPAPGQAPFRFSVPGAVSRMATPLRSGPCGPTMLSRYTALAPAPAGIGRRAVSRMATPQGRGGPAPLRSAPISVLAMSKVLALIGAKGGTLKTTTVASLGHLLALQGLRVLMIDGDPQGDLTTRSGLQRVADPVSSPPVRITYRGESHLDVWLMRSGRKLEEVDLKRMLRHMDRGQQETEPDLIILDTPPALGPITTAALIRSDFVIVGVEPGRESVERLHDIQLLADMHERPRFKALVTRARENTNLFRLVSEQLDELFPGRRLEVSIPLETAAAESAYFDVPPTVSVPDGNCARAYGRLAEQVILELALPIRPMGVAG